MHRLRDKDLSGRRLCLGWLVLLVGLLVGAPGVSRADEVSPEKPPPDSREVLKRGKVEAGVMVGFWQASITLSKLDGPFSE